MLATVIDYMALGMAFRLAAGEVGLAAPVGRTGYTFMVSFILGTLIGIFYVR